MALPVIRYDYVRCLQGHIVCDVALCDLQLSLVLRDRVVAFFECGSRRVGDRVIHFFACFGNASRCTDLAYLSGHESASTHGYLRSGQRCSVVRFRCPFACQDHVPRIDRQGSVRYHEANVREVLCRFVRELVFRQTHRIRVRIFLGHFGCSAECEVILGVQLRCFSIDLDAFYRISGYRMFVSVIHYRIRVALDRYDYRVLARFDRQCAFYRRDHIVLGICSIFQFIGELVVCASCLRDRSGHFPFRTVCSHESVSAYRHLVLGQRGSVIDLLIASTGQGHFSRADCQGTVCYDELHVAEVSICVCELACGQTHRICVRIFLAHFGRSAECDVRFFVQAVADGLNLVAFCGLGCSVILLAVRVTNDRHGHLVTYRQDAQFSFVLGDLIVIGVELALYRTVGDGIVHFTLAYARYASCCLDVGHLTGYESVSDSDIRSGQWCSVIRLAGCFTC